MMRTIHLYGRLKNHFGASHRMDVETAGEAIRALASCLPDFTGMLREGSYQIIRGDRDTGMDLDLEEVVGFRLGRADLHIVPVVAGSGGAMGGRGGAIAKVVLGVALIGAAIFFAPAVAGGFMSSLSTPIMGGALGSGFTYGSIAMMGGALALAGVSQLLTSPEEKDEEKDESFAINGPGNSYEQGGPVPIVIGEIITGGLVASGGVDIEDIGEYKG